MNSKYLLPFLIFFTGTLTVFCQQIPVFNQQAFDGHWYNPAQMGSGDASFVAIRFRSQWFGSALDKNPQTYGIQADLSKVIGIDRVGLGLSLQGDRIQFFNQTDIDLSFAYHLMDDGKNFLSAGILAGWNAQRINLTGAKVNDPNDALVFQGEGNSGAFQAGFGVHYSYDDQFFADLAFPQLLAPDQTYTEQSLLYDQENQLLFSISYKSVGEVRFEPNVMLREDLGGKGLKAGRCDVNLRVHFLQEKFSVRGGYRLGANALIGGVGVNIEPVSLALNYETHEVFGGTFELGAKLSFGGAEKGYPISDDPKPEKPVVTPPVTTGASATELARNLESGQLQAQSAARKIAALKTEVEPQVEKASEALAATSRATSIEGKKYTYNKLEESVEQARPGVKQIENELAEIETARQKTQSANDEIVNRNLQVSRATKMYKASQKAIQEGEADGQPLVNQFNRIEVAMKNFARVNGLAAVNLKALYEAGETAKITQYFQQQLDGMLSPPEGILPVTASKSDGRLLLDYRFPSEDEKYNINTELESVRYLCNHLIQQAKTLQEQGFSIEKVSINSALGYSMSDLNLRADQTYAGEFGHSINVNGQRTNLQTNQTESRSMSIAKGTITIEQLAGLKLYAIRNGLAKGDLEAVPIELNWSGGNPNQDFAQLFTIRIFVK